MPATIGTLDAGATGTRAAASVRMSTEHQQESTDTDTLGEELVSQHVDGLDLSQATVRVYYPPSPPSWAMSARLSASEHTASGHAPGRAGPSRNANPPNR